MYVGALGAPGQDAGFNPFEPIFYSIKSQLIYNSLKFLLYLKRTQTKIITFQNPLILLK